MKKLIKGNRLSFEDRTRVLNSYVHRYTKDHKPLWANELRPDGSAHMPQFASDEDWLEHTLFAIKKDGSLDHRVHSCQSTPTWPDGQNQQGGSK